METEYNYLYIVYAFLIGMWFIVGIKEYQISNGKAYSIVNGAFHCTQDIKINGELNDSKNKY